MLPISLQKLYRNLAPRVPPGSTVTIRHTSAYDDGGLVCINLFPGPNTEQLPGSSVVPGTRCVIVASIYAPTHYSDDEPWLLLLGEHGELGWTPDLEYIDPDWNGRVPT